ncbi:hypothetical protein ACP70R_027185 [Stipagrostis hirtigluma subsp. patula]
MAGSDDEETVEIGMNEERRLLGLAGGDNKDDLTEDREALFGRGAKDPIDVDDDDGSDDDAPEADGPDDGNSSKRPWPSTSKMWLDMEKLYKDINGKKVRYGARCLHCGKEYSGYSSGGTGHLARHILSCEKRRQKTRMSGGGGAAHAGEVPGAYAGALEHGRQQAVALVERMGADQ